MRWRRGADETGRRSGQPPRAGEPPQQARRSPASSPSSLSSSSTSSATCRSARRTGPDADRARHPALDLDPAAAEPRAPADRLIVGHPASRLARPGLASQSVLAEVRVIPYRRWHIVPVYARKPALAGTSRKSGDARLVRTGRGDGGPMIEQQARSRPESADGSDKGEVPAVRKTVAIIRYLNGRAPAGATLRETAGDLEITNSHCHNILRTLIRHNWVGYDALSRRYRLAAGPVRRCALGLQPVRADRPAAPAGRAARRRDRHHLHPLPGRAGRHLPRDRQGGRHQRLRRHRADRPPLHARCAGAAQGGPRLAAGGGDPGVARRLAAGRPHRHAASPIARRCWPISRRRARAAMR